MLAGAAARPHGDAADHRPTSRSWPAKVGKCQDRDARAPEDHSALEAEGPRRRPRRELSDAVQIQDKHERYDAIAEVEKDRRRRASSPTTAARRSQLDTLDGSRSARAASKKLLKGNVKHILHDLRSELMRERVLDDGERIDGRKLRRDPPDRLRGALRAASPRRRALHPR